MPFLTVKRVIWLPRRQISVSFAEKAILYQGDRFPEDFPEDFPKICNISIWCMLISQNLTIPAEFFLAHLLSFFPALLLSVPFALYILSGCYKKLGVNYGQSLEMAP